MQSPEPEHETVRRRLGTLTATSLVIASMIGTGVFVTSGPMLADLRSAPAVLAAWVLGGVLALAGALCYAELVAAMPENGGEYHLISRCFHPSIGFAAGFVGFFVGFAVPIAMSAMAFASYAKALWPAIPEMPTALALLLVLTLINAGGVRFGARVQDALTIFKVVLIVAFVIAGAFSGAQPSRWTAGEHSIGSAMMTPAFAVALVQVSFAYTGWNGAAYIAGEVERPHRTLPLSLLAGTVLVTVLYVALNAVFLAAAPMEALSGQEAIADVAGRHLWGDRIGNVTTAIIAAGLVSSVGAFILTGTRILEAMGRDHRRLSALAKRTRWGSPWVALWLQSAIAAVLVVTASFDALLTYVGFTLSIIAAVTVMAVPWMRYKAPELARPYRTWGYPVTPIVFMLLMAWMIFDSVRERPIIALVGGGTIGLGVGLWAITRTKT